MRLCKLLPDGRRQIIGFALPGDFLGLTATQRYFYSAESIAASTLCRFKHTDLAVLFRLFPQMQDRLLRMTSSELAAAQDQMLSLGRKEPVERVATFLASLARRLRRFGDPGPTVTLPMTRADIADYLGLTIETISRSFTKLKTARIIALPSPERVFIADPARLAALARGERAQSGPGQGSE
jgi:CRP/FNR family transcriptional regulator